MKRIIKIKNTKNYCSESIPHDLIIEILSRSPVKSLCRFRSVSKLWNSTISNRGFARSHFNHSLIRSTDSENTVDVANLIISVGFPVEQAPPDALTVLILIHVVQSIHGLVCIHDFKNDHIKVSNPATRQVLTLPDFGSGNLIRHCTFFGYDPINDQHKVLTTLLLKSKAFEKGYTMQTFVFVIGCSGGGDSGSWRRTLTDVPLPHRPILEEHGVCINGIIYYKSFNLSGNPGGIVVAFDVRLETFRFLENPSAPFIRNWDGFLTQCGNKLAVIDCKFYKRVTGINMWVLEDSNWIYKYVAFPNVWIDIIKEKKVLYAAGISKNGELIMAPSIQDKPFDLFFFNLELASVRRVESSFLREFVEAYGNRRTIRITDYVESIVSLPKP